MELQLQTFDRADLGKFRMVLGENGEPLFLASDV